MSCCLLAIPRVIESRSRSIVYLCWTLLMYHGFQLLRRGEAPDLQLGIVVARVASTNLLATPPLKVTPWSRDKPPPVRTRGNLSVSSASSTHSKLFFNQRQIRPRKLQAVESGQQSPAAAAVLINAASRGNNHTTPRGVETIIIMPPASGPPSGPPA